MATPCERMKDVFRTWDEAKSGYIAVDAFHVLIDDVNRRSNQGVPAVTRAELDWMLERSDLGHTGYVPYELFCDSLWQPACPKLAKEESSDDEMDEAAFQAMTEKRKGKTVVREAVCAEHIEVDENWVAPEHEKSAEQEARLKTALTRSFIFANLQPEELSKVIKAFAEFVAEAGSNVITQGAEVSTEEPALFVLEEGELDVFKNGVEGPVHAYKKTGDYFGDLALLYNAPRAATVRAKTTCKLWYIDRNTFNYLVKGAARQAKEDEDDEMDEAAFQAMTEKRKGKTAVRQAVCAETFEVDENWVAPVHEKSAEQEARLKTALTRSFIFANLQPEELSKVIKAFAEFVAESGSNVITQGAEVSTEEPALFVLEEGELDVFKNGVEGPVHAYKKTGDYFGDLALLYNAPRAATVRAKTVCKLWYIDRNTFNYLVKGAARQAKEQSGADLATTASSSAAPEAETDAFGEDDGADKPPQMVVIEDAWHIQSQQAFRMNSQNMTLTIMRNMATEHLRFEFLQSGMEPVNVDMPTTNFDELCKEQSGLAGSAQVDAALRQLYQEVAEHIEDAEIDALGDDCEVLESRIGSKVRLGILKDASDEWQVVGQESLRLVSKNLILTTLEHKSRGLVKFKFFDASIPGDIDVECTNHEFEVICKEQVGLEGVARTQAAISQLYSEAVQEVEASDTNAEAGVVDLKQLLPEFRTPCASDADSVWSTVSQGPRDDQDARRWGGECKSVTVQENSSEGLLEFEFQPTTGEMLSITIPQLKFEELRKAQFSKPASSQIDAAIHQLFMQAREASAIRGQTPSPIGA